MATKEQKEWRKKNLQKYKNCLIKGSAIYMIELIQYLIYHNKAF